MSLAIARGIVELMSNTVTLLVKAMLAAEAAAILLIGVAAMHYSGGGSGSVARNNSPSIPATNNAALVSTQPKAAFSTLASTTDISHQLVMLQSPWAPVDERPYSVGEIEAVAAEVVAKATESAGGSASATLAAPSQLASLNAPAEELPGGGIAAGGAGGAILRYEVATLRETSGANVSSRLLDVRTLPAGWAGWAQEVFTPMNLTGKHNEHDATPDPVADLLDPHLKTMIDALLKTGDGEIIVLRQSDGRFHFYLPEALANGQLPGIGNSFADFSGFELRHSLGFQDYRRLAHLADKPDLQLSYNQAVPEPAALSLLALGGIGLLCRRRHHSSVSK
jgi:hypothetical protein